MSTPVADQPTWHGAGDGPADPADPAARRPQPVDGPSTAAVGTAHVTVDELLARTGSGVRRRRAERREATGRQERVDGYGAPAVRPGPDALPRPAAEPPPVPAARSRRPAVPQAATSSPVAPRLPDAPRWLPGVDRPAVPAAAPRRVGPGDRRSVPPAAPPVGSSWRTPRPVAPVGPDTEQSLAATPAGLPTEGQPVVEPRWLTPIEQEWAGTGHPSLPLPDGGIRRSMPVPPIPGLDRPVPGLPAPDAVAGHTGSTSAGLRSRAADGPPRRRLPRPLVALLVLLGMVAAYYVGLYFYVDRSIDRVDALVTDGPEVLAPQLQDDSQTYLVVGTGLPGRSGPASVSTLIAHVSAAGDRAVLVTVPPTVLTDTPACHTDEGSVREPVTEPFAGALLDGGPSCLVRSVQQLSGLRVDHYLGLDLGSLPGMVDALDGIAVCLPGAATTDGAGLQLPAGGNDLAGDQVTDFLSPGTTGADVTGTAAAEREQLVLTSMLRSALSAGTLANPITLTRFLGQAGDAFTLDADTTLGDVRAVAAVLGDLPEDAVQRAAVPVSRIGYVPAGTDRAVALVDGTATRALFDAVIDDGRLPADDAATSGDPAADAAAVSSPAADTLPDPTQADPAPAGTTVTVAPAGVTVDVLDATDAGRGGEIAQALAGAGFRTGVVGTEPAAVDQTVVRYGPESLEPARTVAAAVPGAVLTETDEVGGAVQLVLGPGEATVVPVALDAPVPVGAAPVAAPTVGGTASCG
ncbi:transcriptional attenuator, LytR family [Modestobacter sp. DSM 44400]|uniref:LCP family protein n=1 Tax=Modestobacter sp. DSM 44400 TaxID=1550230 RepID=UPI00089C7996|nr:LCP family protein [Modestobacter sp. DSM 44400]SDY79247.1 transcriptional attenuator, LytR family [Modestobacter sp. DSM 44400]